LRRNIKIFETRRDVSREDFYIQTWW